MSKFNKGYMSVPSSSHFQIFRQVIDARGCTSLVNLRDGIGLLHELGQIILTGCANLESIPNLPPNIEEINARNCTSLVNLPYSIGQLHKLREISLDGCIKLESISNLPPNIEEINACNCTSLANLPDSIGQLHKMRRIRLGGCTKLESIPNLPPSIEVIHAENCTSLVNLPDSIDQLHKLRELILYECVKLESILDLPPNIEEIEARNCTSLVNLPSNMSELQLLRRLQLNLCFKLEPETFKKVSGLRNLYSICMKNCNVSYISSEIGNLVSLKELDISENIFSSLPDSFNNLSQLEDLRINGCVKLESIPNLPPSIEVIEAKDCTSLVDLPDGTGQLHKLRRLVIDGCPLQLLPLLPPNLTYIEASRCFSLDICPFDPKQIAYIFRSKLFKKSSFTAGGLVMSLSGAVLPNWCNFKNRGDVLSIVAPMNNKICGVIICATIERNFHTIQDISPRMLNKTKNTSHLFWFDDYFRGSMAVMFYPLNDTTLVVEEGDLVVLQFDDINYRTLSCGLSLIYEDDVLDSTLLIQNVPAAT